MKVIVVGASSGLGRCIGVGLARRGCQVALMARRRERLDSAAAEAGNGAIPVECDVTDDESCRNAVAEAVTALGGLDAFVYAPAIGPLALLKDTDGATWRRVFDTNVIGASLFTAAALPHLTESRGKGLFLSSIAGSFTAPWPGLGSYAVSKAALERLIDAWRTEHPDVGFTRVVVGDCTGGEGESMTEFNASWDMDLTMRMATDWINKGLISATQIAVEDLVDVVDSVVRSGSSMTLPVVSVIPRLPHRDL